MAQSENGMMSWQSVAGIVAATFAGCAAVITWLDNRAKKMLAEATTDLKVEMEELKKRVTVLENGNRSARTKLNKAMIRAARAGDEEMLALLEAADADLH